MPKSARFPEKYSEKEFIEKIYTEYYRNMYYKAFSMVNDKEEAKEIIQETFIKLIGQAKKLMAFDENHLPYYVMISLTHTAIDHLRRKPKGILSLDRANLEAVDDEDSLPEEQFIHTEELESLSYAIEKLPECDRVALESKYFLSLTDEEIANLLNISPSSVRVYISRARKKAYKIMEGGVNSD